MVHGLETIERQNEAAEVKYDNRRGRVWLAGYDSGLVAGYGIDSEPHVESAASVIIPVVTGLLGFLLGLLMASVR